MCTWAFVQCGAGRPWSACCTQRDRRLSGLFCPSVGRVAAFTCALFVTVSALGSTPVSPLLCRNDASGHCRRLCSSYPLGSECLLFLAHGEEGLGYLRALQKVGVNEDLDREAISARLGITPKKAHRISLFLDAEGLFSLDRSPWAQAFLREVSRIEYWVAKAVTSNERKSSIRALEKVLADHKDRLGAKHQHTALVQCGLGLLLTEYGDYRGAYRHYRGALRVLEGELGDEHPYLLRLLNPMVVTLIRAGKIDEAQEYMERVKRISAKVDPEHPDNAYTMANLAFLYRVQGNLGESKPLYEAALRLREKVIGEQHPTTALSLNSYGNLLRNYGDYQSSALFYEKSMILRQKVLGENHRFTTRSINNVALLLWRLGELDEAKKLYERIIEIREHSDERLDSELADVKGNYARVLLSQGEFEAARRYFERVFEIRKEALGLDNYKTASSLNNLGLLYRLQGEPAKSLGYYHRALKIFDSKGVLPGYLSGLIGVGDAHLALQQYSEALKAYRQALKDSRSVLGREHPLSIRLLNKVGLVYWAKGNLKRALDCFQEAHRGAQVWLNTQTDSWQVYQRALRLRAAQTQKTEHALLSLLLEKSSYQEALSVLFLQQGRVARGVQAKVDLARLRGDPKLSQQQKDALSKYQYLSLAWSRSTIPPQKERALSGWQRRRRRLKKTLAKLEKRLGRVVPVFEEQRRMNAPSLKEVCGALAKQNAHLLNFSLVQKVSVDPSIQTQARYIAFSVEPKKCEVEYRDLGTKSEIEGLVNRWRSNLDRVERRFARALPLQVKVVDSRANLERLDESSAALYARLLAPFQAHLPADPDQRVWIVPDGALTEVPLGALRASAESYALERWAMGYLSSAAKLLRPAQRARTAAERSLVLGDVNYQAAARTAHLVCTKSAPCAPKMGKEVVLASALQSGGRLVCPKQSQRPWRALGSLGERALASKLALRLDHAVDTLVGATANEPLLRHLLGERPEVVHINTHAYSAPQKCIEDQDVFGRSALVLAGANEKSSKEPQEDGFLTAREILKLDLRGTRLVTLSACETGRGLTTIGEGALGLATAFRIAGAASVVVSQWKVDSEATKQLFERFYARAYSPKDQARPDAVDALIGTQRALVSYWRKKWRVQHSAYLWGSFLAMGVAR